MEKGGDPDIYGYYFQHPIQICIVNTRGKASTCASGKVPSKRDMFDMAEDFV